MTDGKFVLQEKKLKATFRIDVKPSKLSELENDINAVNKEYVDNAIENVNSKIDNDVIDLQNNVSKVSDIATNANMKAEEALSSIKEVTEKADEAKLTADSALLIANSADTKATTAMTTANNAQSNANSALAGLNTKQDIIPDLDSIRSGANKGNTALQEVPPEYVTNTQLSNYHDNSKQDTLTATQLQAVNSGITAELVAQIGDVDLSEYAKKQEIPTKVSDLENDLNFVSETTLTNTINPINTNITALSNKVEEIEQTPVVIIREW